LRLGEGVTGQIKRLETILKPVFFGFFNPFLYEEYENECLVTYPLGFLRETAPLYTNQLSGFGHSQFYSEQKDYNNPRSLPGRSALSCMRRSPQ
jgi:hypothetical protein